MSAHESKISNKDAILYKTCPTQMLYIKKKDMDFKASK